ncbi:MAG: HDOD domain-containing protein [Armatimonadetes bacterium]|nr:HDOD domain-containing protein [Armatimonadota bacterium]
MSAITSFSGRPNLAQLLETTTDLPVVSSTVLAVISETEAEESTAQSVGRLLQQDPALTARVLRLANSSFYSLRKQVFDVNEAVVILGMRTVRRLAVVASTYPWLCRDLKVFDLASPGLWEFSYATATFAQTIADRSRKASPDAAFTCGLLADIGKIAMSIWFDGSADLVGALRGDKSLAIDHEFELFGFHHAEVGYQLTKMWGLPNELCEAIRYSHTPSEATSQNPLLDCLHCADYLTRCMGIGLGSEGLRIEFDGDAWSRLGLTDDDFDGILSDWIDQFQARQTLFTDQAQAA